MAICINATFALDVNKIENHHGYFFKDFTEITSYLLLNF